jgi:aldehyde:ferredoxin oxidoreductase
MSDVNQEYTAKVLKVDLSSGRFGVDELDAATLRKYIGGYALGAKYLYEEVPASAKWSDPENRLMFLPGVLTGTAMPGAGGVTVCAKGAMTGGAAATQAQGDFGAFLKRCGFLGVVLHGASNRWTYLVVDENGKAQLRDAEHLLGKDTWETVDAIVADLGKREREISVFCIGPGGENLVRWAAVIGDKGHVAAHNGVGAVMGSKKLKAVVAVRGKTSIPVKDAEKVREIGQKLMEPVKANQTGVHYYGTLAGVHRNYVAGTLPVKNYTTSVWDIPEEQYQKFTGPYIYEHFNAERDRPCWACSNRHCQAMTFPEGPYAGLEAEEPEYEQISAFSASLAINEVEPVVMLGNLADRLGLDVNETGWICSFVMECFDKGILTSKETDGLEVRWGDVQATRELILKIARREGIGDILAEGVRLASQEIGRGAQEIGIYTMKGAIPRGHDHRARWAEMFDTCVSESGALENSMLAGIDLTQFGLPAKVHPYDPDMLAQAESIMKGAMQLEDSAVTCRFNTNMNVVALSQAISAVTGWDFTFDEGMQVGRRAVHTMRAFNIRSGLTADMDRPSPRYGSTPVDGPAQGQSIAPHFEKMLQLYYQGMGWDETGKPLPETLRAFGLEKIVSDLWGANG